MKFVFHGVFLFIISIIQSTWLSSVEILGIKPNLYIVYVIVAGCFCGRKESAVVGAVFGLFSDVMIGIFLGGNMLLSLLLGYFVSFFCENTIRNVNGIIVMLITLCISSAYELVYFLFAYLINITLNGAVFRTIFIEGFYNSLMSVVLYFIMLKPAKKLWLDKGEGIG